MSEKLAVHSSRGVTVARWVVALALVSLLASLLISRPRWERWLSGETATTPLEVAPTAPALMGPVLELPTLGTPLTAGELTFQGRATPHSAITALVDGVAPSDVAATADATGAWSLTLTLDTPGIYEIHFQAQLEQQATTSVPYRINLLPPPPAADLPTDGLELHGDALVLAGSGAPGTTVQLLMNGLIVGQTPVDVNGRWQLTTTQTLPGTYTLLTQVVDADGQVLGQSSPQPLMVWPAFISPTITSPPPDSTQRGALLVDGAGAPGGTIQLVVDSEVISQSLVTDEGTWRFQVPLPPASYSVVVQGLDGRGVMRHATPPRTITLLPAFATPTLTVDRQEILAGEALTLTGAGEPAAQLTILVNAEPVASVAVAADGLWRHGPLIATAPGLWRLTAESPAPDGLILTSAPVTVTILPRPMIITPTVTAPQGSATYVTGEQKLSGVGDPLLNLGLVINGGSDIPIVLDETGAWSLLVPFEPGDYEIFVVGRDASGAEVIRSAPLQLTVVSLAALPSCLNVTIYGLDRGDSYIVAPCETLARIAQRTGLTVQKIVAANPQLSNPNNLRIGQTLVLPRP